MQVIRSLIFNVGFFGLTTIMLPVVCLTIALPRMVLQNMVRFYGVLVIAMCRGVLDLRHEIRGREHLPDGPCLIVAKHQSVWDTIIFYQLLHDPCYVLKKELLSIPLWGWAARHSKSISVDRKGGASALKQMVRDTQQAIADGRTVIIFPEGTRTTPGKEYPYQPGAAAMQKAVSVPVVPVALNSGLFWGRHSFIKHGGTITLEFLPPLASGQDRKQFMTAIKEAIEPASLRLMEEARQKYFPTS